MNWDSSVIAAIAGLLGAVATKAFDFLTSKKQTDVNQILTERELIAKEHATFRQEMRDELVRLRSDLLQLSEENDLLKHENLELKAEIAQLRGDMNVLRHENQDLRAKLENRTSEESVVLPA